ncbi:MAG: DegQ family serine endoprotease [Pseudomonadota bacterium]
MLSVLVALAACTGDSNAQTDTSSRPNAAVQQAPQQQVPAASASQARTVALPDFAPLVEQVGPAVVNVEVIGETPTTSGIPGLSPNDPFYEFFRRFGIPAPGQGPQGSVPPPRGAGSGFIVSPDGYILTNAHVVDRAAQVTVKLTDRREFVAKVVGVDTRSDVAVIKIDAENLPTVRIGNASELRPGEWVLAIGSPFGLENSATAGIVSATSRTVPVEQSSYVPFIQTDVAVNPGNSGGPLINMRGEVVGINSMIFSRTGGYMGVSFAIPIDVAMDVREQLISQGYVTRGRIGVQIQEVNAQFAKSFGLDRPRGALVGSVEKGGPADKAGVQPGDVILAVNGRNVETSSELPGIIMRMKPGTTAKLTVWRNGKPVDLNVQIAQLEEPNQQRVSARDGAGGGNETAARLGLTVRQLTPQEKQQLETEGNLVVAQVSGGPALAAGIRPGDVILGVAANGRTSRVNTVQELAEATKKAGDAMALLIQRGDTQIFIPLRLG